MNSMVDVEFPEWRTEKGFEVLFRTLYAALLRYAISVSYAEFNAEELVQDAFLKLWNKRAELSDAVNVKAYLYKMVYNAALNTNKHDKVKTKHASYMQTNAIPKNDNIQQLQANELSAIIHVAIAKLPQKCRLLFYLSREEGLSYKSIAERLNISTKTVEHQISKALSILRVELKDYLHVFLLLCLLTPQL